MRGKVNKKRGKVKKNEWITKTLKKKNQPKKNRVKKLRNQKLNLIEDYSWMIWSPQLSSGRLIYTFYRAFSDKYWLHFNNSPVEKKSDAAPISWAKL